jgi:hypothetical protein|tara:strand:+ start:3824 stop:4066 length:243 start_codon:yes stop_codon:yes gene_type:complete
MGNTIKMKFKDAPIGARFKFPNSAVSEDIWIKLNSYPEGPHHDGSGLIVNWNGNVEGGQSFCCWVDKVNGYDFDSEIELV